MKRTFSTLSLNLRFGLADDGPNCWDRRKKGLKELFQQYREDFIALQEANDFQIDYVCGLLPEYDYIGKRTPAPPFWQNNVIFYKTTWRCRSSDHFYLSPTPCVPSRSRNSRWPRQCTMGRFERSLQEAITIADTHLDFDSCVQVESAAIIMKRLASQGAGTDAVLMGDFNAGPSSACHQVFTGTHPGVGSRGPYFGNAFAPAFPGTFHGFTGTANGDHIDWILFRGRIQPEEKKVIRDRFDGFYPSDHYPVRALFSWTGTN